MGQCYEVLLYHTEVRWLSRGRMVSRVVELREPIKCFLIEKKSDLAAKFSNTEWLSIVLLGRYLCGIQQRELNFARKEHYCPGHERIRFRIYLKAQTVEQEDLEGSHGTVFYVGSIS